MESADGLKGSCLRRRNKANYTEIKERERDLSFHCSRVPFSVTAARCTGWDWKFSFSLLFGFPAPRVQQQRCVSGHCPSNRFTCRARRVGAVQKRGQTRESVGTGKES